MPDPLDNTTPQPPFIAIPYPPEGAWMSPKLQPPIVLTTDEGTHALIPISPEGQRLIDAMAQTKAQLIAETHGPVTETDALEHLQDACGRMEDEDGPYCLQEGTAWCDEDCPFRDFPSEDGPIAWG